MFKPDDCRGGREGEILWVDLFKGEQSEESPNVVVTGDCWVGSCRMSVDTTAQVFSANWLPRDSFPTNWLIQYEVEKKMTLLSWNSAGALCYVFSSVISLFSDSQPVPLFVSLSCFFFLLLPLLFSLLGPPRTHYLIPLVPCCSSSCSRRGSV